MKAIEITRASDKAVIAHTLVDDEDFLYLSQWTWRLSYYGYAARMENRQAIRLHNIVAERAGMDMTNTIDHISRVKLDNRRSNLRPATRQEQNRNQGMRSDNTSGVRGVVWHKRKKKWLTCIRVNGKLKHLGYFDDLDEATRVRKEAEEQYFGEFTPTTKESLRNTRPNTEFDSFSIQGAE
jgi:hypothetical protein